MILTLEQLNACMPYAGTRAPIFLECLNTAMYEFDIETPLRQSMFLAQCAHESGSLHYTRELGTGSLYDTGDLATRLGNTPAADGDGELYKGRGLLQITGRTNTLKCLAALGRNADDILYLETPMGASRSAAWFWYTQGLNMMADQELFYGISKKINGGANGMDSRIQHYTRARKALGI